MDALRFVFCQEGGRLRSGWRLLIFLAALFAAALLVGWLLQLVGLQDGGEESEGLRPLPILLSSGLLLASALIVSHFALRLFEGRSLATIGLPLRRPWAAGLAAGLGIGALPVVLIVAAVSLGGDVAMRLSDLSLGSILGLTLPAVLALLFLSSLEEVLLRGYAMQLLAEGGGRWFAALLTGLVFALAHVENPGANILGLVNTGANGVLLAWLVMRTGSLWIACGYHAGWNICGGLLFGMRLSGIDVPGAILRTELLGPAWLSGGDYGFEGTLIAGVVELIVLAAAVSLASRLPGHPEMRRHFAGRGASERWPVGGVP